MANPQTDEFINNLRKRPISETISGIYDYENKHSTWMLSKYSGFVKYFEESYDYYIQLNNSLNYVSKSDWGWPKQLAYIYLGNATYPLFKSFTLLMDGFYDESLTISRTTYELLIKAIYCICHPDNCEATYSKAKKGIPTFNMTNFVKDDLKVNWEFLYSLSSASSHGKIYFTRFLHQLKETGKHELIGLQLKVDDKWAQININYLTFLIWALMYLLLTTFKQIAPKENDNVKVLSDGMDYVKSLGDILRSNPRGFRQVGIDYEKIIQIIKLALDKKDWHALT